MKLFELSEYIILRNCINTIFHAPYDSILNKNSNLRDTRTEFFILNFHTHQNFLPKGKSFAANAGTKVALLSKGRSSTANPETKV